MTTANTCFCEQCDYDPQFRDQHEFEACVWQAFREAEQLLLRKHNDYGPLNISRSPGGPLNGLRVRMWDKIARLNNLVEKDVDPQNESLRDTLIDIANYALIGVIVLDDNWPKE